MSHPGAGPAPAVPRGPGHLGDPTRLHPTSLPRPTATGEVAQVNGVFVVLQGVGGGDPLLGGWAYLQVEPDGVTHEAMDLNSLGGGDADLGAAVVAPLDGVVSFVGWWDGWQTGFGNHVAFWVDDARAAQPCFLHVAHLATIAVREGQRVPAGAPLGTCGKSGNQPYAHTHAAMWPQSPAELGLPGGWDFWQSPGWAYPQEWVATVTVDPEGWFWASATKAGAMGGGDVAAARILEDWQLKGWVLAALFDEAGLPFNPDSATATAWCDELRRGVYRGRPVGEERPIEPGVWQEYEAGIVVWRAADGAVSWNG